MRPNLKLVNLTSLLFRFEVILSEDLVAQVRQASPPDKDGDSVFFDSYKIGNVAHRALAWCLHQDKDANKFLIKFTYVSERSRPRRSAPRVMSLLRVLSSLGEPIRATCSAHFTFRRVKRLKTIVILPLKFIESSNLPFDEILGVHLAKRYSKETETHVILDLQEDGRLMEAVTFSYDTKFHESMAEDIVREAVRISGGFVWQEGQDAGESKRSA